MNKKDSPSLGSTAPRLSWPASAAAAMNVLSDGSWRQTHPTASDWTTDAAEQAGYSMNAFRRQLKVAEFLRGKVPAEQWAELLKTGAPFAAVEVMQRFFSADPHEAARWLEAAISGRLQYRDLLAKFRAHQKATGGGNGKTTYANRAQGFRARAIACVRAQSGSFITPASQVAHVRWRDGLRGFAYARPDIVAVGPVVITAGKASYAFVDAFDVRLFGQDDSKHVLLRTLERCALMERFFRQTWLIYPANDPPVAGHAAHLEALSVQLDALGIRSVGVATVSEQADEQTLTHDAPTILRRPRLNIRPKNAVLVEQWLVDGV